MSIKFQSRRRSLDETMFNTALAFVLSLVAHVAVVAPLMENHLADGGDITTVGVGVLTTGFYTVISVARNYATRRIFNQSQKRRVSLLEASGSTAFAMLISLFFHVVLIAPLLTEHSAGGGDITTFIVGAGVALFYTILAFARNYAFRRIMNAFFGG